MKSNSKSPSRKSEGFSSEDLLDALRASFGPETIPPGWYHLAQLVKELHAKRETVKKMLAEIKAESRFFRVLDKGGKLIRREYWRLGGKG